MRAPQRLWALLVCTYVRVRVLLNTSLLLGFVYEWAELKEDRSMQRNEGPAYHGRPVGSILSEVWIHDTARSNSAIVFDPTGEHCSRTAPAENTSGKINSRLALLQKMACVFSLCFVAKRRKGG